MSYELSSHWSEIVKDLNILAKDWLVDTDHAAGSPGMEGDIVIRKWFADGCDLYVSQDVDTMVDESPDFYDLAFWSTDMQEQYDGGGYTEAKFLRVPLSHITANFIWAVAQTLNHNSH